MGSVMPEELTQLLVIAGGVALFAGLVATSIAQRIKDMLDKWVELDAKMMRGINAVVSIVLTVWILTKPQFGVPTDLAVMAAFITAGLGEKWHDILRR